MNKAGQIYKLHLLYLRFGKVSQCGHRQQGADNAVTGDPSAAQQPPLGEDLALVTLVSSYSASSSLNFRFYCQQCPLEALSLLTLICSADFSFIFPFS